MTGSPVVGNPDVTGRLEGEPAKDRFEFNPVVGSWLAGDETTGTVISPRGIKVGSAVEITGRGGAVRRGVPPPAP